MNSFIVFLILTVVVTTPPIATYNSGPFAPSTPRPKKFPYVNEDGSLNKLFYDTLGADKSQEKKPEKPKPLFEVYRTKYSRYPMLIEWNEISDIVRVLLTKVKLRIFKIYLEEYRLENDLKQVELWEICHQFVANYYRSSTVARDFTTIKNIITETDELTECRPEYQIPSDLCRSFQIPFLPYLKRVMRLEAVLANNLQNNVHKQFVAKVNEENLVKTKNNLVYKPRRVKEENNTE